MVPADERAAQGQKGLVDVSTPLKARAQPTHLVQPGDRALNGLITSDKFCLIRCERLQLSWPRPQRPRVEFSAPYSAPLDVVHSGGRDERQPAAATSGLERAAQRGGNSRRPTTLGSNVPTLSAVGDCQAERTGGAGRRRPGGGKSGSPAFGSPCTCAYRPAIRSIDRPSSSSSNF